MIALWVRGRQAAQFLGFKFRLGYIVRPYGPHQLSTVRARDVAVETEIDTVDAPNGGTPPPQSPSNYTRQAVRTSRLNRVRLISTRLKSPKCQRIPSTPAESSRTFTYDLITPNAADHIDLQSSRGESQCGSGW